MSLQVKNGEHAWVGRAYHPELDRRPADPTAQDPGAYADPRDNSRPPRVRRTRPRGHHSVSQNYAGAKY